MQILYYKANILILITQTVPSIRYWFIDHILNIILIILQSYVIPVCVLGILAHEDIFVYCPSLTLVYFINI